MVKKTQKNVKNMYNVPLSNKVRKYSRELKPLDAPHQKTCLRLINKQRYNLLPEHACVSVKLRHSLSFVFLHFNVRRERRAVTEKR